MRPDSPLAAALWMLAASFLFACMGVCVKVSSANFAASELIWWRGAIAVALLLPWVFFTGRTMASRHWRMHLARGASGVAALCMYFYCISLIPLATAVALNYTSPLFLALIVTTVLRERISAHVLTGLIVGFIGLVCVLQPSIANDQWRGAALGLGSGFFSSIAYLSVRQLGEAGEPEWRTVAYFSLLSCLAGVPGVAQSAPLFSHSLADLAALLGIGTFGLSAQLCMTSAYRRGQPLVTASLSNSTVLFASAFGVLLWSETLTMTAWLGVAFVVVGGTLTNLSRSGQSVANEFAGVVIRK